MNEDESNINDENVGSDEEMKKPSGLDKFRESTGDDLLDSILKRASILKAEEESRKNSMVSQQDLDGSAKRASTLR